jgi:hypothetical protein
MDKSKYENYAKMGKPPSGYNAVYKQGGWVYSPVSSTKQDAKRLFLWIVVSTGCLVGYLVFSYVMGLVM